MTQIFRPATQNDATHIVNLLEKFYAKHQALYQIEFIPKDCENTVRELIEYGVVLVGPNSCAGASIAPFFVNHNVKTAFVWYWAFERPREIRIFQALMAACKEAGATHLTAAAHFPTFTILKHYARLTLRPLELSCIVQL